MNLCLAQFYGFSGSGLSVIYRREMGQCRQKWIEKSSREKEQKERQKFGTSLIVFYWITVMRFISG